MFKWLALRVRPGGYWDGVLAETRGYRQAVGGRWYQIEGRETVWSGAYWVRSRSDDPSLVEVRSENWGYDSLASSK